MSSAAAAFAVAAADPCVVLFLVCGMPETGSAYGGSLYTDCNGTLSFVWGPSFLETPKFPRFVVTLAV